MGRSDAELLEASRRGEREAFGALIERYQGVVCAVSYSRTGNRALSEDVAQDTFIAAWHQLDRLREPSRLRAWLCGIARNLARKARRRVGREHPIDLAHDRPLVFEGANPFDAAAAAESERVVREALARVPETYRDVLVLYYRDQRSVRDVAAALGLSEAAALQRLSRGRQYLADGVTDLVERSLRGARAQRSLVAGVLAALPPLAPFPVGTTPFARSSGASMIKLALFAAAATAAGATAYVLRSSGAPSAVPVAHAAPSLPVLASPPPAPRPPAAAKAAAHTERPSLPVDDDNPPSIDAPTIARLGLYRGPSRGPATAPVTVVVFADMLCPFCGKMLASLDQLFDEYPGKVRLVMKQLPVHAAAVMPAEAVLAADAQGKFWELHDLLMAHQDDLSREHVLALASQAGLDVVALRTALDGHAYAAALAADTGAARELGVDATPTLFINGKQVRGALPIEALRATVEQALAEL